MGLCAHQYTKRGKDVQRQYGSYRTEICTNCGKYRTTDHHGRNPSVWRESEFYEMDTEWDDDF